MGGLPGLQAAAGQAILSRGNICPPSHVVEDVPQRAALKYSGRPHKFLRKPSLRAQRAWRRGRGRRFRQLYSCGHICQMLMQGSWWEPRVCCPCSLRVAPCPLRVLASDGRGRHTGSVGFQASLSLCPGLSGLPRGCLGWGLPGLGARF